jgi:hypothetical protein
VQLYRYFVSHSSEYCRHSPLCCFSTSVYCCKHIFRYRLSPETFWYTLVCRVIPILAVDQICVLNEILTVRNHVIVSLHFGVRGALKINVPWDSNLVPHKCEDVTALIRMIVNELIGMWRRWSWPVLTISMLLKVKLSLCSKHHTMKAYWGDGGIAPLIIWPRH